MWFVSGNKLPSNIFSSKVVVADIYEKQSKTKDCSSNDIKNVIQVEDDDFDSDDSFTLQLSDISDDIEEGLDGSSKIEHPMNRVFVNFLDKIQINKAKRYYKCDFCSYKSKHLGFFKKHVLANHKLSIVVIGKNDTKK